MFGDKNPSKLAEIARDWLVAGADVISTATYQVTEKALQHCFGLSGNIAEGALTRSIEALDKVRSQFWKERQHKLNEAEHNVSVGGGKQEMPRRFPKIAISIGPFIATLPDGCEYDPQYDGSITFDKLYDFHLTRVHFFLRASHSVPIDIIAFETIGTIIEATAIVRAMSTPSVSGVPYWLSLQCRDGGHIASGEEIEHAIFSILHENSVRNLVAVGVNCTDISVIKTTIQTVQNTVASFFARADPDQQQTIQAVAYPNSGEQLIEHAWVWPESGSISPSRWATIAHETNAGIIGGCCRVGLDHIRALQSSMSSLL